KGDPLRYEIEFSEQAGGFTILREHLSQVGPSPGNGSEEFFFRRVGDVVGFGQNVGKISPAQSVLAVYKSPADTTPISNIGRKFEGIRTYREFRTTGDS